jgi:hypothetical protein
MANGGSYKMRGLSDNFMDDLLKPEGKLHPILERVKKDHNLMLTIRNGYINIYYRGGNILRVTKRHDFYQTFFDVKYAKSGQSVSNPEDDIINQADAHKLVACLPERKIIMDEYFAGGSKTTEQEFQQLVARENNNSSISNQTEYFVSDIEVTVPHLTRFDITAIRWLAKDRKTGRGCTAALIEMKYGDDALEGKAGLLEHLKDMASFISDTKQYADLLQTMEIQFNQLDKLGLLDFKHARNLEIVLYDEKKPEEIKKPEIIFILANHNPRSPKLWKILMNPELDKYEHSELFDLKFYVNSFAGYGLHANCMHSLTEIRKLAEVKKL